MVREARQPTGGIDVLVNTGVLVWSASLPDEAETTGRLLADRRPPPR
ncbi:hypothetical protein [Streptomyces sp. NPDC001492]